MPQIWCVSTCLISSKYITQPNLFINGTSFMTKPWANKVMNNTSLDKSKSKVKGMKLLQKHIWPSPSTFKYAYLCTPSILFNHADADVVVNVDVEANPLCLSPRPANPTPMQIRFAFFHSSISIPAQSIRKPILFGHFSSWCNW